MKRSCRTVRLCSSRLLGRCVVTTLIGIDTTNDRQEVTGEEPCYTVKDSEDEEENHGSTRSLRWATPLSAA